jgi:hypothetical protein
MRNHRFDYGYGLGVSRACSDPQCTTQTVRSGHSGRREMRQNCASSGRQLKHGEQEHAGYFGTWRWRGSIIKNNMVWGDCRQYTQPRLVNSSDSAVNIELEMQTQRL